MIKASCLNKACFTIPKFSEKSKIITGSYSKGRISLLNIYGKLMESKHRWKFFPFFFSFCKLAGICRPDNNRLVQTVHLCHPLKKISSAIHAAENFVSKEYSPLSFSHQRERTLILRHILGHFLCIGHRPNTSFKGSNVETETKAGYCRVKEVSDSLDEIGSVSQIKMTSVNQRDPSTYHKCGDVNRDQELENHQHCGKNTNTLELSGGFSESPSEQQVHSPTAPAGDDVEDSNLFTMDTERSELSQSFANQKETDRNRDNKPLALDALTDQKSGAKYKQRKGDKRKGKEQLNALSDVGNADAAGACVNRHNVSLSQRNKRPKRMQPNFFLAVRIHNPQIHAGIKVIQDSIATHSKELKPAFVSLATLHVTLMVMHLEDAEEIQKAGKVLHQCKTSLESILAKSDVMIRFSGLGHFGHRVLYAKLEEEGSDFLKSVEEIVREIFTKEGIPSTDSREYNPHMTVMKLIRHNQQLRRSGVRKIPEESYASWVDFNFGEEPVTALHLCAMGEKDTDGFYKCMATMTFADSDETSFS